MLTAAALITLAAVCCLHVIALGGNRDLARENRLLRLRLANEQAARRFLSDENHRLRQPVPDVVDLKARWVK